ncbi:MAG: hypothetical protein WC393_03880 [Candidatus Nanoarchaeia archaeon]|jgi:hypothetical protein
MKVFVPHYTCKTGFESGVACLKILTDYVNGVKINEKKPNDLTEIAVKTAKKISINNPLKIPLSYDLINLAVNNFNTVLFRQKENYKNDYEGLLDYENKIKSELMAKGMRLIVSKEFEEELLEALKDGPVIVFVDFNKLYKQLNLGFGWLIALEYNESKNELITYDPMYYSRLPKSRNHERLKNTFKNRYISFNKNFFIDSIKNIDELIISNREKTKRTTSKPFIREFFAIYKKENENTK